MKIGQLVRLPFGDCVNKPPSRPRPPNNLERERCSL